MRHSPAFNVRSSFLTSNNREERLFIWINCLELSYRVTHNFITLDDKIGQTEAELWKMYRAYE